MTANNRNRRKNNLGLMALEPRWMFDGAAAVDAAHAAPDASAKALIPDAPAPVQIRAADPSQDGGKKEVVFVDTSVANYQALEAAVKPGIEIEEIAGGQSGLAQMAKWAETHPGYDSISVLSPGAEAQVNIGTDALTDAGLSNPTTQAELAEIGAALKAGGDLMLYGSDVAMGSDGQQFIADIASATGAVVAASDAPIGLVGNWTLDRSTGTIDATAFAAPAYAGDLYIAPTEVQAADPALDGGKLEVVFVETSLPDYQTLEAAVKPGVEIVEINGERSGLEQMAVWAETHNGYDSISVLSHGAEGVLMLGTDIVTDGSLSKATVKTELAQLGAALKPGGDLQLYGCDVAAGTDGQQFITDLAAATGADVGASTDETGAADQGGNWVLEKWTGVTGTATMDAPAWEHLLATPTGLTKISENDIGVDTGLSNMKTKGLAISPDGLSVYITDYQNNAVALYSRDSTTGALTYVTDYTGNSSSDLHYAAFVIVSPDNKNVYVFDQTGNMAVFSRDTTDGTLTHVQTVGSNVQYTGATFTSGGDYMFVIDKSSKNLIAYSRDLSTGVLTQLSSSSVLTNGGAVAFGNSVSVSPDNNFVYVSGSSNNQLEVFSFTPGNGASALAFVQALAVNAASGYVCGSVIATTGYVYVAGENGTGGTTNTIVEYTRDATTGMLSNPNSISVGQSSSETGGRTLVLSSDGNFILALFAIRIDLV